MEKKLTVFCYTDIHNQSSMLDLPTVLRTSAVIAAEDAVREFGKADVTLVGGDNVSDYPYWNRSAWLPKENFLDLKAKLVRCMAATARDEKVLYVAGNNDMILGDIGGDSWKPYNTTEFYFTGPMKDTLGELSPEECLMTTSEKKPWEYPYLDAFHYVIRGVDFIGINIDPNTAYDSHEGHYTDETLRWLKAKLDEIDPDGNRLIFVVGHLSAACYPKGGELYESMINGNRELFYESLNGHRNLFYLYGHVHGEKYVYRDFSSGAVLHVGQDLHTIDANLSHTDSSAYPDYAYCLVHMGGLRPFHVDEFEPDGRVGFGGTSERQYFPHTGTPKLAQYLVIEVYEDRVVFQIRNTGSLEGYTRSDKPAPYTVYLRP